MKKRVIVIVILSILLCLIGLYIFKQNEKEENYKTEATKSNDRYYIVEKSGELYCFGSESEEKLMEYIKNSEYKYIEYGGNKTECDEKIK